MITETHTTDTRDKNVWETTKIKHVSTEADPRIERDESERRE